MHFVFGKTVSASVACLIWTVFACNASVISASPDGLAVSPPVVDLMQDTWSATGSLNRPISTYPGCPPPRQKRTVGIFYFLWQGEHGANEPLYDNTTIIDDSKLHQYGPPGSFHWWGQPAVGYYHSDDPWVARKNLTMLADAGVDVLVVDVTNALIYLPSVRTLCDQAEEMVRNGQVTPRICFMTRSRTGFTVTQLYDDFYSKGSYSNLWFYWKSSTKPLLLGDQTGLNDDGSPMKPVIRDFFEWRNCWAWEPGHDKWQWIDNVPQRYSWHESPDIAEEAPVSVAGHATTDIGRSNIANIEPSLNPSLLAPDTEKGDYFAAQWSTALRIDPEFIFVTGWNEWIAQRFVVAPGQSIGFLGKQLSPSDTFFVDNYNEEFSRDIMPMRGGYGDNYYIQFVNGIRRYKRARQPPTQRGATSLTPTTPFQRWTNVVPAYNHEKMGPRRDWDGWGGVRYTNDTGRNNILLCKVACDPKNIYFYVKTATPMTSWRNSMWMQLLIGIKPANGSSWNGYGYLINGNVISSTNTTLLNFADAKFSKINYRQSGSEMVVCVPRILLGLTNYHHTKLFFHWVDNAAVGPGSDIVDWWYDGDSSPDGRFNYVYENTQ